MEAKLFSLFVLGFVSFSTSCLAVESTVMERETEKSCGREVEVMGDCMGKLRWRRKKMERRGRES